MRVNERGCARVCVGLVRLGPFRWVEHADAQGRPYYRHSATAETCQARPVAPPRPPLPPRDSFAAFLAQVECARAP